MRPKKKQTELLSGLATISDSRINEIAGPFFKKNGKRILAQAKKRARAFRDGLCYFM